MLQKTHSHYFLFTKRRKNITENQVHILHHFKTLPNTNTNEHEKKKKKPKQTRKTNKRKKSNNKMKEKKKRKREQHVKKETNNEQTKKRELIIEEENVRRRDGDTDSRGAAELAGGERAAGHALLQALLGKPQ